MTNDIAVRVHKDSVVQDSIYGRRVRGLDVFLTVIIYTCAGFSILLLAGIMGYEMCIRDRQESNQINTFKTFSTEYATMRWHRITLPPLFGLRSVSGPGLC